MSRWVPLFTLSALLMSSTITPKAFAVVDCPTVNMTVTASLSSDPGFEGLYKYTVTGNWDVTRFGVSHIDFFLALESLECVCDPRVIKFASPAGTSTGVGGCTVTYTGIYNCMGDPAIPAELRAPAVKFEPDAGCEPGVLGSGTWTFYSPFPPAPYSSYPDAVAIKHGQDTCLGDLSGQMPNGDCTTPARASSWGQVKAVYR